MAIADDSKPSEQLPELPDLAGLAGRGEEDAAFSDEPGPSSADDEAAGSQVFSTIRVPLDLRSWLQG